MMTSIAKRRLRTTAFLCACLLPTLVAAQQRDQDRNYDRDRERNRPYREADRERDRERYQDPADSGVQTPDKFAYDAAWMGLKEVRLGEIAQAKASDSEVREFAAKMVRDHGNANNRLMQLAQNKGYVMPATNVFAASNRDDDRDLPKQGLGARKQTEGTRPDSDLDDDEVYRDRDRDRDRGRRSRGERAELSETERLRRQDLRAVRRLQNLSASQFDRAYITEMIHDHRKAVNKFRTASETVMDEQVKQFAKDALPILEDHYAHAQRIARSNGWNVERGLSAVESRE